MKIYEIFLTLQGESSEAGLPVIVVRLGECNLRCSYCDTAYAYEYKFLSSPEEISEKIKEFLPVKNVLITGGEPLLQKKEVSALVKILLKRKYTVSIETNGSVSIKKIPAKAKIIMDLKTPSSGECGSNRYENLSFLTKNDELKFVIGDKKDYLWAKGILEQYPLKTRTVLFSPVYKVLQPELLGEWILQDKLNVRLQLQLHKILNIK